MQQGWIKLYRKIVNWEWYTDLPTFKLFVHLLITANRNPARWRGNEVNQGELITSVGSLSVATGLSVSQVRTALKKLERTGEILVKTTRFCTKITVVKYSDYQAFDSFEQQTDDNVVTRS